MAHQFVLTDKKDQVGYLILNRPEKLNALNRQTMQEIGAAVSEVAEDENVGVLVVTGAGDGHCGI